MEFSYSYQVIVPTLGKIDNLKRLLFSFKIQSVLPKKIWLILDKKINDIQKKEYLYFFEKNFSILNIVLVNNLDYDFTVSKGVSYVRNYGLKLVLSNRDSDFLLFIDDDIAFDRNIIKKCFEKYEKFGEQNFLIYPKVYLKNTKILQSCGIKKINPFFGNNVFIKNCKNKRNINMCSLQFLFGPSNIFKQFLFDNNMKFVYEDLDYTKNITKNGYKIYGFEDIFIHHYENKKNKAQTSYVANPFLSYEKGKNRVIFARKHFYFLEKIVYFSVGIFIHSMILSFFILVWGENKIKSLINLYKGTFRGFFVKLGGNQ